MGRLDLARAWALWTRPLMAWPPERLPGAGRPPPQSVSEVYRPVVRGFMAATGVYYLIVTATHPFYETGWALLILAGLSSLAAGWCAASWLYLRARTPPLWLLETASLTINLLLLVNVLAYQLLHFETSKLVYFVLVALAAGVCSPSRRVAVASIVPGLAALLVMAPRAGPALASQYSFVGLAGAFVAFGMATLLRGAIMRELKARLAAEALNQRIEAELARNEELRRVAQDLALREQAANRAKTEFLATMSHELRTPLNGILGMAEAMSRGALAAPQRKRLQVVQSSGDALLRLVNDVLDISKIEAGRLELSPAAFDLARLAASVEALYRPLAEDKGLSFGFTVTGDAQGWRLGDEVRLRQVLSNLIANAIKFTDRGGLDVQIGWAGGRLSAAVSDTGIGMAPDVRARLFERFMQADGSTTRKFGGTGLGLAICRELVGMMGGAITAESREGEGSTFRFEIPLPEANAPAAPGEAAPAAAFGERPLAILVADDNATNLLVLTTLLGQLGADTVTVENGAQAVEAWRARAFDLVLMDVHMPELDGLAATRAIRAAERLAGRAHTPIVAVTASVLAHETDAYAEAGMDAYVAKPIAVDRLVETLAMLLSAPAETGARSAA